MAVFYTLASRMGRGEMPALGQLGHKKTPPYCQGGVLVTIQIGTNYSDC
jgi:hypothetical protein